MNACITSSSPSTTTSSCSISPARVGVLGGDDAPDRVHVIASPWRAEARARADGERRQRRSDGRAFDRVRSIGGRARLDARRARRSREPGHSVARAARRERLAAVCTGAFVSEAGCSSASVSTHWAGCDVFQLYPRTHLEEDAIYVCEVVWTSRA
jgi:transcriptional regulator GlxA family with amidase domain